MFSELDLYKIRQTLNFVLYKWKLTCSQLKEILQIPASQWIQMIPNIKVLFDITGPFHVASFEAHEKLWETDDKTDTE